MSASARVIAATLSTTAHKISGFRQFPRGWRYGEGEPPSPETVSIAQQINRAATNANFETDAFLGLDADIRVTVYYLSDYLQFTVDDTGHVEYVREQSDREIDRRERLSVEVALELLGRFEFEIWRSSVSSTATNTIRGEDIFRILHSKLPEVVRVSRSSSGTAQYELAPQSADT